MRTRSLRSFAGIVAPLAAVVIGGPAAGVASAETCAGTLNGNQQLDSLVVRDGGNCSIAPTARVLVDGRVEIGSNARLSVRKAAEGPNKAALNVQRSVSMEPGSRLLVGGTLIVKGALTGRPEVVAVFDDAWIGGRIDFAAVGDQFELEDVAVDGDIEVAAGGRGGISLNKVSVDGDVQIHDRRFGAINVADSNMDRLSVVDNTVVGIRITDNIIGRSLTCLRNETQNSTVFGNVVAGVVRARGC
jgi:hypothetical protein